MTREWLMICNADHRPEGAEPGAVIGRFKTIEQAYRAREEYNSPACKLSVKEPTA